MAALKKHALEIWTAVVKELQQWQGTGKHLPGDLGGGSVTFLGNLAEATSLVLAVSLVTSFLPFLGALQSPLKMIWLQISLCSANSGGVAVRKSVAMIITTAHNFSSTTRCTIGGRNRVIMVIESDVGRQIHFCIGLYVTLAMMLLT